MNGDLKPFGRGSLPLIPRAFLRDAMSIGATRAEAKAALRKLQRDEIWLNDEYQVNVDKDPPHAMRGMVIWHLSIKRRDKEPIHDWRDLQAIKNALAGPEFEAVELYPSESRLVDTANQFHLWVFYADGERLAPTFPVGWSQRAVTDETMPNARQRPGAGNAGFLAL